MKKIIITALLSIVLGSLSGGLTTIYLRKHRLGTISVRQIVVTDKSGMTRATLGTDTANQVSLELFSPDNARQLLLGVVSHPYQRRSTTYEFGDAGQPWAPLIELDDVNGRQRAMLTTAEHGNAIFDFYGPNGSYNLGLGYVGDGSDVRGPGINYGAWGLRAQRGFDDTSIGVLDYTTANGEKYMFPNQDEPRRLAFKTK